MSQVVEVVEQIMAPDLPPIDLPEEDGIPLETNWHRAQINLFIEIINYRWRERQDFFAGGNMFVYFSLQQIRQKDYRGPDFFLVKNIDGSYPRQKWVAWEEDGHYPDVIIELMSPSTAQEDLGPKKTLYERTFRTPEYFCYNPDEQQLHGWRLSEKGYKALVPNPQGWLWSDQFDAWLGLWRGPYLQQEANWLRLFDDHGQLVLIAAEAEYQRAEEASQRAEEASQRAEAAEAELARLREAARSRPKTD